jgi:hypothetical protein
MWLWWPIEDRDIPFALDPNLESFQKELTQDQHTAEVVGRIVPTQAVGLPFLNFLNSEPRGDFQRNGRTLYAPAHSNPWCDFSKAVHQRVEAFTKDNDVTVLLSWNDRKLAGNYTVPVEIGAGVWEVTSFYRMRKLFSEYSCMITDRMGSHVLYALACGMKVGLSARYWNDDIYHPHAISYGLTERARYVRSLKYLDELYPGIVLEDGLPTYDNCPDIMHTCPFEIARLLEWPVIHTA